MKKYLPLFFITTFPYIALGSFYLMFDRDLGYSRIFILAAAAVWWFAGLAATVICVVRAVFRKESAKTLAVISMVIKAVQIPAYLWVFVTGMVLSFNVFTMPFVIVMVVLDAAVICCTGAIGTAAVIRSLAEGNLSKTQALIYGIFQFVYCLDIVFAIILCVKTKKRTAISQ